MEHFSSTGQKESTKFKRNSSAFCCYKKNVSVPAPSPGLQSCPHKELSAQTALFEPPLLPFEFPASSPLLPSNGLLQFLPPVWDKPKWLIISGQYVVMLYFTSILVLTEPSELPKARFLQTQSLYGPRLRLSNMKPASQIALLLGGWSGSSGPHLELPCHPGKHHQRDHDLIMT